jgi:hypothetical protein
METGAYWIGGQNQIAISLPTREQRMFGTSYGDFNERFRRV